MVFSETQVSVVSICTVLYNCLFILNFEKVVVIVNAAGNTNADSDAIFVDSDAVYKKRISSDYAPRLRKLQALYDEIFEPTSNTSRSRPGGPLSDDQYLTILPDLSHIGALCSKNEFFAYFNPLHGKAVKEVVDFLRVFSGNTTKLLEIAQALKNDPNINRHLWFYAISMVGIKSPELQLVKKLQPYDAMPDSFVPSEVIEEGIKRKKQMGNASSRQNLGCINLDEKFGSDNGIENRLWYFRENIFLNSHHWYYHQMYPHSASPKREDRRGELFYYMHASVLARYNADRLSNGLIRVQVMNITHNSLLDPYKPHLTDWNSGQRWSARTVGTKLVNLNRNQFRIDLAKHLYTPLRRLKEAIDNGHAIRSNNRKVSLAGLDGIDILGDMVQCHFAYSINLQHYNGQGGYGYHNTGHILVSYASDPDGRKGLPGNAMSDPVTSMRDPIFYKWHMSVQLIFDRYKKTLPPYQPTGGQLQLLWPGVKISNIQLKSGQSTNELTTFWRIRNVELYRGIDLTLRDTDLNLCIKELAHQRFSYEFQITKDPSVTTNRGTVRIYMAPRFNSKGIRLSMNLQRTFFFVLDVFPITLKPGSNNFVRYSNQSLLTIPNSRGLQNINENDDYQTPYCGCGWPENLLIPKGTAEGMEFDLFIMVTNGDDDYVKQDVQSMKFWDSCIPRPIYCGIVNQKYPDAKPMGYPFDRLPYSVNGEIVQNLDAYISGITNMGTVKFQIKFKDEIQKG